MQMMVRQKIIYSHVITILNVCDSGSNNSVSALLFWLGVQTFAQILYANTSENPVAAVIDSAASETINAPADLANEQEVASVPDPEVSGTAEVAAPDTEVSGTAEVAADSVSS
jgi:hypothetical protein